MIQHKPPTIAKPKTRSLYDKQQSNGRTLALNGKAWATLRAYVLSMQPLCESCMDNDDRPVMATEVDHVDGNPANNCHNNLASLCKSCHSRKTNAEMGHKVTWGCDVNGVSLDPAHPWRIDLNKQQTLGKSPATKADEPHGTLHAQDRESYRP